MHFLKSIHENPWKSDKYIVQLRLLPPIFLNSEEMRYNESTN